MSKTNKKVLMWFRNDLRIADNLAFDAACKAGIVVPIYILDPQDKLGAASKWWLSKSLEKLNLSLENNLIVYEGDKFQLLPKIMQANEAKKIFWNVDFERFWQEEKLENLFKIMKLESNDDEKLDDQIKDDSTEYYSYNSSLLWDPATILKHDGSIYKVFTPFYRKGCLGNGDPRKPIPAPSDFLLCKSALESNYRFVSEKWHQKMERYWSIDKDSNDAENFQDQKSTYDQQSKTEYEDGKIQTENHQFHKSNLSKEDLFQKQEKIRTIKIGEVAAMERLINFVFPKMIGYQQNGQRNEAKWKADKEHYQQNAAVYQDKTLYKGGHHEQNEAESIHDDLQKVNHNKTKIGDVKSKMEDHEPHKTNLSEQHLSEEHNLGKANEAEQKANKIDEKSERYQVQYGDAKSQIGDHLYSSDSTRSCKHFAGPGYAPNGEMNYDDTPSGILNYREGRNFPGKANCSALSPHIHFGEISPNQIWHYAKSACEENSRTDKNAPISKVDLDHFHSELGWREFSYYILYHFPNLSTQNFQAKFNKFNWKENPINFERWKKGQTGYPIVDAGMRELWKTGYMHNRVRMITASFLVKNLMLDWRLGEAWFYDCLVDADLASNSASWQWVAGTGTDAAPYFRIFNPILQGEKFDPEGIYTLKYVPELEMLSKKYLFCPFQAPEDVLTKGGVKLGNNYPTPIIDLETSRKKALEEYKKISLNNEQ